jgi:RNA polymerase sigma-70 factor (ECF subfamily)
VDHDQELDYVRRARGGDRDAFARLIDIYWDRLRCWLYGLTGQRQAAEDLTQEAFLKAWTALPRLKVDRTFRSWLFRIARNCLLDARRGPRGQPTEPLNPDMQGKEPEPLTHLLQGEAVEKLRAALDRLPLTYRAAYLLWTQEELPYPEIARALHLSQEAARWRVCRARRLLLKEMRPYLDRTVP